MTRRAALAVALAAAVLSPASPTSAAGAVDCVVDGRAKFRPALSLVPADTGHRERLVLDCSGDPADTGTWILEITARTNPALPYESCAQGEAFGTLAGSSPDGPVTGIVQITRRATLVSYAGQADAGGHPHQFALELTLEPRRDQNCVTGVGGARLVGTGFLGPI